MYYTVHITVNRKKMDNRPSFLAAAFVAQPAAVVGSIIRRTSVILSAGNPLRLACSRMTSSFRARRPGHASRPAWTERSMLLSGAEALA